MSVDIDPQWAGVKNLVHEAFSLGDQNGDLLDEMKVAGSQKHELLAVKKTEGVALQTFRQCHDIPTFQEITDENVCSLIEAAEVLQGKIEESDSYYGLYTASLIAVAKLKIGEGKLKETEKQIGEKLESYASKLDDVYRNMETDLINECKVENQS